MFKKHPVFHQNPQAIQIVAYYDEMETANALGPKASKNNKLGALIIMKIIMYTINSTSAFMTVTHNSFRCVILYDSKSGALHEI